MDKDETFEHYKNVTSPEFVTKFQNLGILSALTKNELYSIYSIPHKDRKYYDKARSTTDFTVAGRIYVENINSFANIEYIFNNLKDAEKYYEVIVAAYPISSIKIIEKAFKEVRLYV